MSKEKTLSVTLDKAREWYHKGGELKEIAMLCFNEEELKEQTLPKTWEECFNIYYETHEVEYIDDSSEIVAVRYSKILCSSYDRNIIPKGICKPMLALMQLLVCREVYRDGWKPDWTDKSSVKYEIYNERSEIQRCLGHTVNTILSFQSKEVRDQFLENFKDLIEEAKELI